MAEATSTPKSKAAKPAPGVFETPKVELPSFEVPKFEVPVVFRELAEKGAAQAKEAYDRIKAAAEDSSAVFEDSCATAAKGVCAYQLKLIEIARANTNAAFDLAAALAAARSLADVIEATSAHARQQFDAAIAQSKDLTALAQKTVLDSFAPLRSGFDSAIAKL